MKRTIVYGDIHGCYDPFVALRKQINPKKDDLEICVGDIITKGKESLKTLDFIIQNNIQSVLGNHEDKLLRYLRHEKSAKKNPMHLDEDEQNIINKLSDTQQHFLENMPLFYKSGAITILHGGIQNNTNLEDLSKRDREKLLRLRYLDKDGYFVNLEEEDENSIFWADIYEGDEGFIVYGHQPFEEIKKSSFALGIDTGCVYGNKLSAVVFDDPKNSQEYALYSVKSE